MIIQASPIVLAAAAGTLLALAGLFILALRWLIGTAGVLRSKAVVQVMGPAMAAHLAMVDPPADVIAAALSGTTIEADKTPPPAPRKVDDLPPVGTARPTFDYTHLNRTGADLFAAKL